MMDYGCRLKYERVISEYGEPVEAWTEGEETECGIEFHQGTENPTATMTTDFYNATLRIPHSFTLSPEDRFRLTKYRDEDVDIIFEVVTPIWKGMTGNRLGLKVLEMEGSYEGDGGGSSL